MARVLEESIGRPGAPHRRPRFQPLAGRGPSGRRGPGGKGLSWWMVAAVAIPLAALLVVALIWPLLDILLRSLNADGKASFSLAGLTLANYGEILGDSTLRIVVRNTFIIAAYATVITTLLAFPVAYLMTRLSRRLALVILTLVLVPFWISILVRLFAFTAVLGKEGIVNSLAGDLGLGGPYSLLFNRVSTVLGMTVYLLPYMILVLYAAMSNIDGNLMSAARTLGANGRRVFFNVFLPQVRPALLSGVLLIFVLSLGFFLTPAILGGPKDITIPVYIQTQVGNYQWGVASAIGIALLVTTLLGFVGVIRWGAGNAFLGGRVGKGVSSREPLTFSLFSVSLWLATLVCIGIMLLPLLVVIPVSFSESDLLIWPPEGFTFSWYEEVATDSMWLDSIRKSLVVGIGTALFSTALGLGLARLITKMRPTLFRSVLQMLVFAPLIVPVILLAIGTFGVQARIGLIGTTPGLIIAHSVVAIPLAFIVLSSALSNLDRDMEQAAWSLGASRRRTFTSVVLPNITPSLVGALLITFVTSWDEAVIALFQTGTEKTLPVTIYSLMKTGVEPAVAAVATILIFAVAVGFFCATLLSRKSPGLRSR